MSNFLDKAELIKSRLQAEGVFDGIEIIIDRQKDILSEISQAVSKAGGACVTILWQAGELVEGMLTSDSEYLVRIWTVPILRDEGDVPADDLAEAMAVALQGLSSDGIHCGDSFEILSGPRLVPHEAFLIYELLIQCRHDLSTPTTNHE